MEYCPNCDRPLKNINAWHYCERVDLDDILKNKAEEVALIVDQLLVRVCEWEEVYPSVTKNCVVFLHKSSFLIVRPMKTQVDIKFFLEKPLRNDVIHKVISWNKKYAHHVRLKKDDDVTDYVLSLIYQSYEMH